jgi:hypothetical protein
MEKADPVPIWVSEVGLTPEPRAVRRVFFEDDTGGSQLVDLRVKIVTLEVENDVVCGRTVGISDVDGKGGVSIRALEPSITGKGIDDLAKAEYFKKLDCLNRSFRIDSYLVEVHRRVKVM